MIDAISLLILSITALGSSIVSGITGMGGGTIMLAVIAMLIDTSYVVPLHASIQLVSNSTRLLLFLKHIKWKILLFFVIGIIPGAILGINIFNKIDKNIIKLLMGIFILLITLAPKSKNETKVSYSLFAPIGFVAGIIGIFFGAIGPFIAPFFIRKDVIKEELVATKAACQMITHMIKLIIFGFIGINIIENWKVFITLGVLVVVGTLIGKKLLNKLSDNIFRNTVKTLLVLIAIKIIITQAIKLI
jgi:uncharacterized membrane protein YfcA